MMMWPAHVESPGCSGAMRRSTGESCWKSSHSSIPCGSELLLSLGTSTNLLLFPYCFMISTSCDLVSSEMAAPAKEGLLLPPAGHSAGLEAFMETTGAVLVTSNELRSGVLQWTKDFPVQ